ncbi:MAG: shikimate kinase [Acidobacteriota bacterium]
MRVFLVGFMGAGKSTTGHALASRLGALFWDLDARIEATLRMSVPEIFRQLGEPAFRAEETRQLAGSARFADLVAATGGGTFAVPANRELIARLGVSVHLDLPWEEILRRLPGKRGERPLFNGPEQAYELFKARLPLYRLADIQVRPEAGEDAEALAGRILFLLGVRP